jgi:hypothetical protein
MTKELRQIQERVSRLQGQLSRCAVKATEILKELNALESENAWPVTPNPFRLQADILKNGGRAGPPIRAVGKVTINDVQAYNIWTHIKYGDPNRPPDPALVQKFDKWRDNRDAQGLPPTPPDFQEKYDRDHGVPSPSSLSAEEEAEFQQLNKLHDGTSDFTDDEHERWGELFDKRKLTSPNPVV